jgi:hypothetical protein
MGGLCSSDGIPFPDHLLLRLKHVSSALSQVLQKQKQMSIREPEGARV